MSFTPPIILLIFGVQFLAYLVKGLIGFGNPLISAPLLSMQLDNILITPGTGLIDCPTNAYIAWKNRRSIQFRRVLPTLIMVILGSLPGTLLLQLSVPWVIKTLLGFVVVILGLEMATRKYRSRAHEKDNPVVRMTVAFFSGVCAGLFGINMFIVAYFQRTTKDYNEFKGSLCFLFLGENIFRLASYLISGLITRQVRLFALISLPAEVLALCLSNLLGPKCNESKLQSGAIILFLLGGVSIIVKSLLFHT